MTRVIYLLTIVLAASNTTMGDEAGQRATTVAKTKGLIAFWDFSLMQDGKWTSHHDDGVMKHGYPVVLRRIGDPKSYRPDEWPYTDGESKLVFDSSGPFGHAVRFNKGYIFAEVPRSEFDRSPLDIYGRQPFTLIAWVKFVGKRHLVAGIWDEGGWDKYGGRRQIALFGGLFGSKGVIGHISATGASICRAAFTHDPVASVYFTSTDPLDAEAFEEVMENLPAGVVRVKGVLYVSRIDGRYVKYILQYAGGRRETFPAPWGRNETRQAALLFLGMGFDAAALKTRIEACVVPSAGS